MRVAHIIDGLGWGGAQKLLLTFTETASRRGIDTLVISLKPERNKADVPERLKAAGAKVIQLSYRKLFDPRAIPVLVSLLKNEQASVVHTHLSHSNILGSLAAKAVGIPAVSTLHNTRATVRTKLSMRIKIERYCLRGLTARVIAVGENVADVYRPLLGERALDVIPNAVSAGLRIDAQKRKAIRTELMGNSDRTLAIAVGRLQLQKGYRDMLSAFAQVHELHPRAFLIIVGVGSLLDSLTEYCQSLGISDHVRFLGARGDVPELLAAADVFVNSSHWEGLSIAMLEAMAAGLPVVATAVGDAEILLSTGGGLLAEAQNPDAFARALTGMLDDPEKMCAMGRTARDYVERNYSAEAWLDKLMDCYTLAQEKIASGGK